MVVFVDTGPLLAFLSKRDQHHERGVKLMQDLWSGRHGTVMATNMVFAEVMTLLQRRPGDREVSRDASRMFWDDSLGLLRRLETDEASLREATDLHLGQYDRRLSLTDCTLITHARRMGAKVATFDAGFHGLVDVVDGS